MKFQWNAIHEIAITDRDQLLSCRGTRLLPQLEIGFAMLKRASARRKINSSIFCELSKLLSKFMKARKKIASMIK